MTESRSISREYLASFNDFLAHRIGLTFKENRWHELERGIRGASREFGFSDPEACIHWLMSAGLSKKQIEILSIYLTIGETYFFREKESFDILETRVLPELIQASKGKTRPLRIWSAACSTGEEAYSIAIVLDRKKELLKDREVTILATDINLKALEKAETGVYGEWSLRAAPSLYKHVYFTADGKKKYKLKPHIKKMVQFQYLNLAEDTYPSLVNNTNAMDIIFCRNVLMYFAPGKARDVVRGLYRALVANGWLVVAPTDAFHVTDTECFNKQPLGGTIFTKCIKRKSPPSPVHRPPPALERFREVKTERGEAGARFNQVYERALKCYMEGNYRETAVQLHALLDGEPRVNRSSGVYPSRGKCYALLARSYANMGRLNEAEQWCRKAADADKLNPDYHYLHATIFQEQGREASAIQALKRCLYIDPDFILVHFTLGNIMHRRKERQPALRHLRIALSLLEPLQGQDIVSPEEGLTAGRLREIISALLALEKEAVSDR